MRANANANSRNAAVGRSHTAGNRSNPLVCKVARISKAGRDGSGRPQGYKSCNGLTRHERSLKSFPRTLRSVRCLRRQSKALHRDFLAEGRRRSPPFVACLGGTVHRVK